MSTMSNDKDKKYFQKIKIVTFITLICNILLTIIKYIAGFLSGATSLISDATNSLGDIGTGIITMIGNKTASKKADAEHQFGHAKIENLLAFVFGIIISFSALILGYQGIISLINKSYLDLDSTKLLWPLIICAIALITKFSLGVIAYINAKITNSPILKAQAFDHISDCVGTFLTAIALLIIFLLPSNEALKCLDPVCSLIISVVIITGGIKIIINNGSALIDRSYDKKKMEVIINHINQVEGVIHIDYIRSRLVAAKVFIEVEITISCSLSLHAAHEISEKVKESVYASDELVGHCIVHINPSNHTHEEVNL